MTEKKFAWQSYHINQMENSAKDEFLDEYDRSELDDDENAIFDEIQGMPTVLNTDVGMIIKDDSMSALRRIEHRICHTNFTITKKIAVITNFIEGVETLAVISRYQMIVGFGRLFNASEVRRNIENALINIDDYPENLYQQQLEIIELEAL